MKKQKIFFCDTTNLNKAKKLISLTKTNKLKIGYKFGLEFMNSKHGKNLYQSSKIKLFLLI